MPDLNHNIYMIVINSVIDFVFFIDIILNFRTTYYNSLTGDEVRDPVKIAKNYVFGGKFVIDFLASVPLDTIVE